MFIISKNPSSKEALQLIWNELQLVNSNFTAIEEFSIGDHYLFWFSAKPQDQLSVFKNGFIIGKTDFNEDYVAHSIEKKHLDLPEQLHPLLQSTKVEVIDDEIVITPNHITSIFYSEKGCVSDHQLLIAKHEQLIPNNLRIQLLCGIGYFPGNLTLFESVKKIPYLFALHLKQLQVHQIDKFNPKPNNDNEMMSCFLDSIPDKKEVTLSISGGMDSRFVLGLLLKKGIKPNLVTLKGNELNIVNELASQLQLNLEVVKFNLIPAYQYSLMTDGRIYFRGGNYSQMVDEFKPNELIYNGLAILPTNENSFASAWKKPGKLQTIYEDLIDYALIQRVPIKGFHSFINPIGKLKMKDFLTQRLSFGKQYHQFTSRKQWAIWFYHLHRGLTWTPAHLADLSFYIHPVFILSDKKASEIGISCSAYANFNKERLRKMNQKLFNKVRIDYSDNRKFESESLFILPFSKIYNEYFRKFFKRFQHLKTYPSQNKTNWFENLNDDQAKAFKNYFKTDLKTMLFANEYSFNEKRIAVTLNHVLLFLEK